MSVATIGTGLAGCLGDGDDDPGDPADDGDDTAPADDGDDSDDSMDADDSGDDSVPTDDTGDDSDTDPDDDIEYERLRFVVISDGHWGVDAPDEEHFRFPEDGATDVTYQETHQMALEQIHAVHDEHEIDFLVDNGDVVHDEVSLHEEKIDEFYSELPEGVDWYPTFGNHDWATDEEWEDIYGHPKQHTFQVGDYGAILTETGLPRDPEHGRPANADPNFIEQAIDDLEDDGAEFIFGFQHIPPYPSRYGQLMPNVQEQWGRDSVAAVFCGHNHNSNDMVIEGDQRYFQCELVGNRMVHVDRGIRVLDVEGDVFRTQQLSYDGDVLMEVTFDPTEPPEAEE